MSSDSGDTDDGGYDCTADLETLEKELKGLGLAPKTAERYSHAVDQFHDWCRTAGKPIPDDSETIDLFCALYLVDRRNRGFAPSSAVVSGLRSTRPGLQLPYTLRIIAVTTRAWKVRPALPFDEDMVLAICAKACARKEWSWLVTNLAMWIAYLRVSEALRLKPSDISILDNDTKVIFSLPSSKTSANRPDSVLIDGVRDPSMVPWIKMLKDALQKLAQSRLRGRVNTEKLRRRFEGSLINGMSYTKFSARYNELFEYFGADRAGLNNCSSLPAVTRGLTFRSHSMRRGRCTDALCRGHSIESIMIEGRWQHLKSFRRYCAASLACLVSTEKLAANNSKLREYMDLGRGIRAQYR